MKNVHKALAYIWSISLMKCSLASFLLILKVLVVIPNSMKGYSTKVMFLAYSNPCNPDSFPVPTKSFNIIFFNSTFLSNSA